MLSLIPLSLYLARFAVGPVPVGINSFDFTASAPQPNLLPSKETEEILGVTVLILTGSYRDKEFVRVGYYVNTEYEDEARRAEPPANVDFAGLIRNVLVEKPRVTRFNCPWDSEVKTFGSNVQSSSSQDQQQQGQKQSQSSHLDAPRPSTQSGNASDNIYASPAPPPVIAHGVGSSTNGQGPVALDMEMA